MAEKDILDFSSYLKEKYDIIKKDDLDRFINIIVKIIKIQSIKEKEEEWLSKKITEEEDFEKLKKVIGKNKEIIESIERGDKMFQDLGIKFNEGKVFLTEEKYRESIKKQLTDKEKGEMEKERRKSEK